MKYLNLFYIFFLSVLLTACGGGGGGGTSSTDSDNDGVIDSLDAFPNDPTETVDTDNDGVGDNSDAFPNDPTQTEIPVDGENIISCDGFASHLTPIGRLSNNTWNSQAAGDFPYKQCIKERVLNGKKSYGWSWEWPDTSNSVFSYPEIIVGAKPWEPGPGNDDRFPRTIQDTPELYVTYDLDTEGTGIYNLATSIWMIDTPTVSNPQDIGAIKTELMIWTDSQGFFPGDPITKRGEVAIDGYEWEIWAAENWGDASGANPNTWTYILYFAKSPTTKITYDARKMLDDAISRGLINESHYISVVELGNEILSGSGRTWINRFSVDLTMPTDSIPQP